MRPSPSLLSSARARSSTSQAEPTTTKSFSVDVPDSMRCRASRTESMASAESTGSVGSSVTS